MGVRGVSTRQPSSASRERIRLGGICCLARCLAALARLPQVPMSHQRRSPFLVASTNTRWHRASAHSRTRAKAHGCKLRLVRNVPLTRHSTRTFKIDDSSLQATPADGKPDRICCDHVTKSPPAPDGKKPHWRADSPKGFYCLSLLGIEWGRNRTSNLYVAGVLR